MNANQSDGRSHYELSFYRKVWWWGRNMVFLFYHYLLVPLLSMLNNSMRSTPAPDLILQTYNMIGRVCWVGAHGTTRQLCFLNGSISNCTERGGSNWSTTSYHTILRLTWRLFRRQCGSEYAAHKSAGRAKICPIIALHLTEMTMTTPLLSHPQCKNGPKGR